MTIRKQWARLGSWIDGLSLRERGLILLMVIAILYLLWDFALMGPLNAAQKQQQDDIAAQQQQLTALQKGIGDLLNSQRHGEEQARARIEQLHQAIEQMDDKLGAATNGLIKPADMPRVLRDMLKRQHGLTLLGLKTLPPTALNAGDSQGQQAVLYRHGLEITVQGRYQAILDYVAALEKQPWQFYWKSFALKSQGYPENKVTLVIYTLSLDKEVLGV